MIRRLLARLIALAAAAIPLPAAASTPDDPEPHVPSVLLVTLDGVRSEEIFGGLDEAIAAHSGKQPYSEIEAMRERFGAATPAGRRERLMPHLWRTLVPQGVIFGNRALGSAMRVQNPHCISSPGYMELITGAPRAEVVDNTLRRYPYRSALEAVAGRLGLPPPLVAQFGSWDGFAMAAASREGVVLTTGGFDTLPPELSSPETDLIADLRREVMGLWQEGSDDVLTFRMAERYIDAQLPRLAWIGLGNSDDWAHADRYDRYLAYLHLADRMIIELWSAMQETERYRDRTTLILTTDHGRGLRGEDWSEHDCSIPGSEWIWAAVIGPQTPDTGEARDTPELHQGQIAATILQYFGLPPGALSADARPPLPGTFTPPVSAPAD